MANPGPWSYDTLRENASKNWTLAGDDQVLRLMTRIGKNLESRTLVIHDKMEEMAKNVDRTCVQLQNVNNKLLALQKTHFLDHRVQDDEDYLRPAETSQESPAEKGRAAKANAEEVLKKVLKDTVNAVDKCYEKIVLDWSDSILDEDDDVIGRTMIRPMDPYKDVPRPHLIGSSQWKESQFVGLKPEPEKIEEMRPKGQFIREEREETVITVQSTAAVEPSLPETHPPEPASYSERFFQPPDISSDLKQERPQKPIDPLPQPLPKLPTGVFVDETPPATYPIPSTVTSVPDRKKPSLFAELEDESDWEESGNATPALKVPQAFPKNYKPQVNLFDDEPPEMDEKITSGIQNRNLFDDDLDGEVKVIPKKKVNLFDDDKVDLFAPKEKENIIQDQMNNNLSQKTGKEETKRVTVDENRNPRASNDTFKQSMEEMLRKGLGGKTVSRPPSMNQPETEKAIQEIPPEVPTVIKTPIETQKVTEPQPRKLPTVPKGLFDDLDEEDEDDLFANPPPKAVIPVKVSVPVPVKTETKENVKQTIAKPKKLFDDVENYLFGPTPDHLIGSLGSSSKPPETAPPQRDLKASANKFTSRLFEDDSDGEEDDLFKPKPVVPKNTQSTEKGVSKAKGLFGEDLEDEDLFSKKKEPKRALPRSVVKKSSLFDDSEEDEDLFNLKPKEGIVEEDKKKMELEKHLEEERKKKELEAEKLLKEEEQKAREMEDEKRKLKEQEIENEKKKKLQEKKEMDQEKERLRLIAVEEKRQKEEQEKIEEIERKRQEVKAQLKEEQERKEQERLENERIQEQERQEQEKETLKAAKEEEEIKEKLFREEREKKLRKEEEEKANQLREEQERIKEMEEANKIKEEVVKKTISLFDDLEDDIEESFPFVPPVSVAKPFSPSAGLFDEPPEDNPGESLFADNESTEDDDDLFSGKKPSPPNPQRIPSNTPSSAPKKKIVDLFCDLPPEDDDGDDLFSTNSQKKSPPETVTQKTNVFYDDMAESLPPEPEAKTKREDKVINPPKAPKEDLPVNPPVTVQSVRDLIKSHETPTDHQPLNESTTVEKKPLPKKLNTNLVINVNAFLPGARPPPMSQRKAVDSPEQPSMTDGLLSPETSIDQSSTSVRMDTPGNVSASDNSALLSSLNKGRAKVSVKRRPSTRKGRAESLRKSQLFDEDVILEQESSSLVPEKIQEDQPKEVPKVEVEEKLAKDPPKQEINSTQKTRKLFESDEDEDSDDLFKPKSSISTKSVTKAPVQVIKKEEIPKRPLPKKTTSLFSDDDEDEDDLFSGRSSSVKASTPSVSTASKTAAAAVAKNEAAMDNNPLADLL